MSTATPDEGDPPAVPAAAAAAPFDAAKGVRYSVANLGAAVVYSLFNFALPLYLETYKLNPSLIGLLANERSFVGAFVQPVVGRLSDRTRTRFGRRRPFFLIGIPLMSLALLILATHPPFWLTLAIMAVAAFFLSIAWDPYMALLADLFPPDQRGRVGGMVGATAGLGTVLFLVIAFGLWSTHEFLVFGLVVGILLLTWAYTFVTVPEPPPAAEDRAPQPAGPSNPVTYLRSLAPYPEAMKYTLAVNFFWLGTGGAIPFITLFGQHVLGATADEAFLLPLMATVVNGLGAVPIGYLADRLGKKRVMSAGLVLFGVAGLIGSQSQTLWQGILVLSFIGLANAAMAQINPMLADLVPRQRTAEFIGLGSAIFSFAQPVGSVLAGAVVTGATGLVGSNEAYRWAFIFAGLMVLLAAALLQTVHPERVASGGPVPGAA